MIHQLSPRLGVWLLAFLSSLVCMMCWGCVPAGPQGATRAINEPVAESLPLATRPSSIDLGRVTADTEVRREAFLVNSTKSSVKVGSVVTSCPCLRVSLEGIHIPAGGEVPIQFLFDPSSEPDFSGRLAIEVTGSGAGDKTMFRTTVKVIVSAEQIPK